MEVSDLTREELEQIRDLQYRIDEMKRDLIRLNNRSVIGSPQPSESHGSGIADTVAARGDECVALEQELAELTAQRDERIAYINGIRDSMLRTIVRCYCVYGFKWKKIAEKVGGRNSEHNVMQMYNRFMSKLS